MLFSNYIVFIKILLFIAVFMCSRMALQKKWLDRLLLIGGNILILTQITSPKSLFLLFLLSLLTYSAGLLLYRKKLKWLMAVVLFLLVGVFSVRNYPLIQGWFGEWWTNSMSKHFLSVEKIGLSYILFRIIHWLVENYRQKISSRDFFDYLNWLFFFPTFPAGPIDTLNNFSYWFNSTEPRLNLRMALAGVGRIFYGAVKTLLIVPIIKPYAIDYQIFLPNFNPWLSVVFAALLYSLYIYIDFSGYCDMAIGMAYTMGIRTPENFNNPYFSTNISDFWKRWHMTFSSFLKLYVFKPVIALLNRFPIAKHRMVVSVTAYLITFFVCGIWHGSTLNFVIWGLWHGIGLSLYKIFSNGRKQHENSTVCKVAGICFTFLFVTIGWIFFNYPADELVSMFNLLFR